MNNKSELNQSRRNDKLTESTLATLFMNNVYTEHEEITTDSLRLALDVTNHYFLRYFPECSNYDDFKKGYFIPDHQSSYDDGFSPNAYALDLLDFSDAYYGTGISDQVPLPDDLERAVIFIKGIIYMNTHRIQLEDLKSLEERAYSDFFSHL